MMFMMSPTSFSRWMEASNEIATVFQELGQRYVETMQKCMTGSTQAISKITQKPGEQTQAVDSQHVKTGLICFKDINNANREAVSRVLHIQMNTLNLDGAAVLFRELTTSLNNAALKEIEYQPAVNFRLDDQGHPAEVMSWLGTSTAEMINYKNLNNSLTYRLAQQEAAIGAACLEAIVLFVKKLRTARVIEDVIGAQMLMLFHIQSQIKDSTLDSMQTLTAFKAGVNVWTENIIDGVPSNRLPSSI
ncbi:hypothetical protein [Candidatus Albibeggiatoa sp. nov. NOAA]|uniref:hypothetical protein n=1 Tax=Candidatus Albibeggiatoa sp. nov. NOAA TaxID=3162724 RepID=UPI0032FE7612|nr:hypothetical protein [Thiotrichaceae bacterium]